MGADELWSRDEQWTVLTDEDLSPCSGFHDRITPVFNAVLFEDHRLSTDFPPCTHGCLHIFDILYCRLLKIQHLQISLANIILKFLKNCSLHLFADSWTPAHLYFWETLPHLGALWMPNHVTVLLPINLISCNMFPQHFVDPILTLETCGDHKLRWANIFHEFVKFLTLNILFVLHILV